MKKMLFAVMTSLCALTAFAASPNDTAAVVKDEKADNAQDKKAVKQASPKAIENAKKEANKTKAQPDKASVNPDSGAK